MEILPAISAKNATVISDHSPPRWVGEPSGHSGRRIPAIEQPQDCSHSLWWALRKLRTWKYRILAPGSWGADQRNDFSEPRLLHLPIRRKVPNSLTWDIWFSLIYKNLLMFRLLALCCKAPMHHGFPLHLLRTFLSGLLYMLPPRLES